MTKQSSSSREKLSSGSSTSFHSPSNTISSVSGEELSPLSHPVSTDETQSSPLVTPPSNYTSPNPTYACSSPTTNNNQPIVSTCVDSLDDCAYSSTSVLGLTAAAAHSQSPPAFIKKEHLQLNISSNPTANKPTFINSLLVEEPTNYQCAPCMCSERGELTAPPNFALNTVKPPSTQSSQSTPKNNCKPTKNFDSLVSLSTSIFQLKSYSTSSTQPPTSSSILFTDESSPFLNDRKCLSDSSKYSSLEPDITINTNEIEHYSSTPININTTTDATKNQLDSPKPIPPLAPTSNTSETHYCHSCQKKLPILSYKCKCGLYFCNKHRHAELHNCSYDYKAEKKDYLRKNITSVIADKVRKI